MLTRPCNAALPYLPCHPPVIVSGLNGAVLSCPLQHSVPLSLLPLQYFKPAFGALLPAWWGAAGAGIQNPASSPLEQPCALTAATGERGYCCLDRGRYLGLDAAKICMEKGWKVLQQGNRTGEGKELLLVFPAFFFSKNANTWEQTELPF